MWLIVWYLWIAVTKSRKLLSVQSFDISTWSTVPQAMREIVGGYDHINNKIWVLGKYHTPASHVGFWSFDVNKWNHSDAFVSHNAPSSLYITNAQSYTQQNDILYIIDSDGTTFNILQFSSDQYTTNWNDITIPLTVHNEACLTSINNYLVVAGGYGGKLGELASALKKVQIYNISGNVWLNEVPSMIYGRCLHGCVAYNDEYIYQIGGHDYQMPAHNYHYSVEKLYVADMNNIANQIWIELDDKLSQKGENMRAVINDTRIYVIGGYYGRTGNTR